MTIDHVGHYLFPSIIWLRIIGRIAFPCFLYTTIQGTERTRDYKKYTLNLLAMGVVSQVLTGTPLNILFQLALFSLSLKNKKASPLFFALSFLTEYGGYGFLLGWSIYLLTQKKTAWGLVLFFLLHLLPGPRLQVFALLFLPFFFMKSVPTLPRPPKAFGYWYYPGHIAVLRVLAMVV